MFQSSFRNHLASKAAAITLLAVCGCQHSNQLSSDRDELPDSAVAKIDKLDSDRQGFQRNGNSNLANTQSDPQPIMGASERALGEFDAKLRRIPDASDEHALRYRIQRIEEDLFPELFRIEMKFDQEMHLVRHQDFIRQKKVIERVRLRMNEQLRQCQAQLRILQQTEPVQAKQP